MSRIFLALGLLGALAASMLPAIGPAQAQKAGRGEKVCKVKMKYSGQVRTFVCKIDEPCCAWHEINYVKCGSPVFRCL
jgi:hypothetical protein